MRFNKIYFKKRDFFKSFLVLFFVSFFNLHAEKISAIKTIKDTLSNCRDEVLTCIELDSSKKGNCFYDLSLGKVCQNYKIKNLSLKRFLLEPDKGSSTNQFNYKARVDTNFITSINCLSNFDQKLTSYLMSNDRLMESQIIELNGIIDNCKLKLSEGFNRN